MCVCGGVEVAVPRLLYALRGARQEEVRVRKRPIYSIATAQVARHIQLCWWLRVLFLLVCWMKSTSGRLYGKASEVGRVCAHCLGRCDVCWAPATYFWRPLASSRGLSFLSNTNLYINTHIRLIAGYRKKSYGFELGWSGVVWDGCEARGSVFR